MGLESAFPCFHVMMILLVLGTTGEAQGPELALTGKENRIFLQSVEKETAEKIQQKYQFIKIVSNQRWSVVTNDIFWSLERQRARGGRRRERQRDLGDSGPRSPGDITSWTSLQSSHHWSC